MPNYFFHRKPLQRDTPREDAQSPSCRNNPRIWLKIRLTATPKQDILHAVSFNCRHPSACKPKDHQQRAGEKTSQDHPQLMAARILGESNILVLSTATAQSDSRLMRGLYKQGHIGTGWYMAAVDSIAADSDQGPNGIYHMASQITSIFIHRLNN